MSHDGLTNANRIDTTTDTLAIQIKHKTANQSFAPSDICGSGGSVCGQDYLIELAQQAVNQGLQPTLVTNRAVGPSLQNLLAQLNIQWMQVAD